MTTEPSKAEDREFGVVVCGYGVHVLEELRCAGHNQGPFFIVFSDEEHPERGDWNSCRFEAWSLCHKLRAAHAAGVRAERERGLDLIADARRKADPVTAEVLRILAAELQRPPGTPASEFRKTRGTAPEVVKDALAAAVKAFPDAPPSGEGEDDIRSNAKATEEESVQLKQAAMEAAWEEIESGSAPEFSERSEGGG